VSKQISTFSPRRRFRFRHPLVRLLSVLASTGLALLILGVLLGLVLVGRRGGGPIQEWDDSVWRWSIHHRGPFIGIDKVISTAGDAGPLGPLCVLAGIIIFALRRSPRALIPISAYLGGEGLVYLIRAVIHRPRPATANYPAPGALRGVHETSYSFPSGHAVAVTAVLFALFGALAVLRRWRWPWLLAFILSAFVADSRLLLGVHWFGDVAIGMVLGGGWGTIVALTLARPSWHDLGLGRRRATPLR
jgi:membrane-associated phospholipid phosphatase